MYIRDLISRNRLRQFRLEKMFVNVDGRTNDEVIVILLAHSCALGSGELIIKSSYAKVNA